MPKTGVLGIGLIGGSIAKSLPNDVTVWDSNRESLAAAASLGIQIATSLDDLVKTVDVLVISVPFAGFDEVFAGVQKAAVTREKPLVVTNVLSVLNSIEVTEPNVQFVASHPMAGTEFSGFKAAKAGLFEGATWVLEKAQPQIEALIASLGAKVVIMPAEMHNEAVSRMSHLPHVLAAAQLLATPEHREIFSLAASSFRDSTRVASTAPELTAGMVTNNRDEVLRAIEALQVVLAEFSKCLENRDDDGVLALFELARQRREELL